MVFNKEIFTDGTVVLINKPLKWTSFQVVNKIRWLIKSTFNIKKIKVGHAGTLDPLAEGLLIICTGRMTKKISEFQNLEKEYSGTFNLGATTPSFDLETEINQTKPIDQLTNEMILERSKAFKGKIFQTPPIYSAVKHKGKKLYEYARQGEEIEIKKREVTIHEFIISSIQLPKVYFHIKCSKGTYIRSLANDFGKDLKCGAHLTKLVRNSIGKYKIEDAISIDTFEEKLTQKT
ncbi:MAG: tRNA pseudouridine(55) synthase TruB [Flavobacteriaceae bacterium]|nr:tRNA pseudouridine(55) synthase TruB [Flavobacteriaceae bacterium]